VEWVSRAAGRWGEHGWRWQPLSTGSVTARTALSPQPHLLLDGTDQHVDAVAVLFGQRIVVLDVDDTGKGGRAN